MQSRGKVFAAAESNLSSKLMGFGLIGLPNEVDRLWALKADAIWPRSPYFPSELWLKS